MGIVTLPFRKLSHNPLVCGIFALTGNKKAQTVARPWFGKSWRSFLKGKKNIKIESGFCRGMLCPNPAIGSGSYPLPGRSISCSNFEQEAQSVSRPSSLRLLCHPMGGCPDNLNLPDRRTGGASILPVETRSRNLICPVYLRPGEVSYLTDIIKNY